MSNSLLLTETYIFKLEPNEGQKNILEELFGTYLDMVKEYNFQKENYMKQSIRRYGRRMNRRIHSIPFRKTQSHISYKSVENGLKPETVEAKNTSKTCLQMQKMRLPSR